MHISITTWLIVCLEIWKSSITEEFNLAANYENSDVCNAEFYRTFASDVFFGSNLLCRLKAEKQAVGMEQRERVRLHFDILKQTI